MNRCIYTISIIINGIEKNNCDNSVRYIPINEKAKGKNIKPNTIKAGSLPRKQNKKISQNNKQFFKNIAASGFGIIK